MSVFSRLKNIFFSCTAQITQSAEDRPLFRVIREQKVRTIVEIGVGDGERTLRMLQAAVRNHPQGTVEYAGIDLFEARPNASGEVSLKGVHRKLKPAKARVRLVPGDPYSAMARMANQLVGTELLLINADQVGESLDRAWFYIPRMLAANATILIERTHGESGELIPQPLSRLEVEALAAKARPRRMAA